MKIKVNAKVVSRIETSVDIVGATLLTIEEEVEALPNHLRPYTNWWWLRSPGYISRLATYAHLDGSVDDLGNLVHNCNASVRPALQIANLKSTDLKVGDSIFFNDKEFEIISDTLAFCKTDIGTHWFRKDWQAEDANDYEESDVKKFVDDWFERAKNEDLG